MDIQECLEGKPDGLSLANISIMTKMDIDTARIALKDLVTKGIVGEKGKTRGHRYYLISEIVLGTRDVMRPEAKEPIPEPVIKIVPVHEPVIEKLIEIQSLQPEKPENIQEIREFTVGIVKRCGAIYRLHLISDIREEFPGIKNSTVQKVLLEIGQADGLRWPHWGVVEVIGHPREG
jgi:hypothetical protein